MYINIENSNEFFGEIKKKMKYGQPELKKFYQKYIAIGLSEAIILHLLIIGIFILVNFLNNRNTDQETNKTIRVITTVDLNTSPTIKEIPEIEEMAVALKDLAALAPEPVAKKFVTEEVKLKSQKELEKVILPVASTGTDDPSKVNPDAVFSGKIQEKKVEQKIEKKEEKKKVTDYREFEVERAPVAVNLQQVKTLMIYPEIAKLSGIEGRVVAKVLVDRDGSIVRVADLSGPNVFYDEVREKIMTLQFTPALQNGQPVRCWVSVPFSFKLSSK